MTEISIGCDTSESVKSASEMLSEYDGHKAQLIASNSVDFVDAWSGKGLTGIYTDYFTPNRWLYGENGGVPEAAETDQG